MHMVEEQGGTGAGGRVRAAGDLGSQADRLPEGHQSGGEVETQLSPLRGHCCCRS